MEGYGRWITLSIFIIVMSWVIYKGFKEDKEEMKMVLTYLTISILGLIFISFIANNW
jgi:predicted type IV restriction endonuclease